MLALAVQIEIAVHDKVPSVDGLAFLEVGKNLIGGRGYVRQGSAELHFPPVVPVSIGVLHRVFGSDMAAVRAWGLITGLAVFATITLLARRLSDDDGVAVAAAWLAATVPGLSIVIARAGGGSEAPALALLLVALWLVVGVLRRPSRPAPRLVGAGALCALAYLTRPESLVPAVVLGCAVLWGGAARRTDTEPRRARATRSILWSSAFASAFVLLSLPYVAFLHAHTGSWEFTGKSSDASISAWRAVAEHHKVARDKVLYRIDPKTDELGLPTRSLRTLAAEDPSGWLGIVRINSAQVGHQFFDLRFGPVGPTSPLLPSVFLVPAVWQLWRARKQRGVLVLAVLGAIPIITCVAFFVHARYLVLAVSALVIFAAWGLVELHRRLPRWLPIIPVVAATLLACSLLSAVGHRHPFSWSDAVVQRSAGKWIARFTPEGARVMTRSYHVQYYGHRPVVAMPYGSSDEVVAFARRHGVHYLVADRTSIRGRRPQLVHDLLDTAHPRGLRIAYESPGRLIRIFSLDPVPAPSTTPPIPLGYVSD